MNFFEQELRKIIGRDYPDAVYSDGMCRIQLGEKASATLSFDNNGVENQYEHIRLTLTNEYGHESDSTLIGLRGTVGAKLFDYSKETGYPFIWENGNVVNWFGYAHTEDDYKPLARVLATHIQVFQEQMQESGMTMQQGMTM